MNWNAEMHVVPLAQDMESGIMIVEVTDPTPSNVLKDIELCCCCCCCCSCDFLS